MVSGSLICFISVNLRRDLSFAPTRYREVVLTSFTQGLDARREIEIRPTKLRPVYS